jgi:hypothetical protein
MMDRQEVLGRAIQRKGDVSSISGIAAGCSQGGQTREIIEVLPIPAGNA